MGIQALVHGKELDVLMYLFQRLLRIGYDTGPLDELIDSQRGEESGSPIGGQDMIGAGEIITQRLG